MAFTKMTGKVDNISALKDRPNEDPGALTSEQLKAEFDKAPVALKAFINAHIDELTAGTAAANLGAKITQGGETVNTTVQAFLNALLTSFNTLIVGTNQISDNAVTGAKIAANAVSNVYSGTISSDAADWTGEAAPYTQTVNVTGILAADEPIIDLSPSDTYATALEEIAEWGKIYRVTAGAGTLTFYATAIPNVDLSFKARCIRK